MDIEEVAVKSPDKILTNKVDLTEEISDTECETVSYTHLRAHET